MRDEPGGAGDDSPEGQPPPARPVIAQLDSPEFDMWQAVGGIRGLVESVAPGVVFVVVFVVTRNLPASIGTALALAGVAMVIRLLGKSTVVQAVSGLGGILIGALWAWRTGEAQDFYVWGLVVNASFAVGTALSILLRRPIVGIVVTAFAPSAAQVRGSGRVFTAASWLWAGAFAARLAVQVPLYLNSHVGWLGTARVLMGVPLWALVLWFTWLLVRPVVDTSHAADPGPHRKKPTDSQGSDTRET